MRPLLCLLATLGLAGCGNDFDPASLVDKLRLLAVKADQPELATGQTTTLTATVANPGGATPTVSWDACLLAPPPASGRSINQDCIDLASGEALLPFGQGLTVTATMPTLTPSMVGLPDQTSGIYLPIRVRLTTDGATLVGFYSLRIFLGAVTGNAPNQNPSFDNVYTVPSADAGVDGQMALDAATPLEVHAKDELHLRALLKDGSQESYLVFDGDPRTTPPRTVTEVVSVDWFSTAGTLTNDTTGVATPDTTLKLDKHLPESGTPIDLWMVARDERGGIDVMHRTLTFR